MNYLKWLEIISTLAYVEERICMYDDKAYYSKENIINLITKLKQQLNELRMTSHEQEAE